MASDDFRLDSLRQAQRFLNDKGFKQDSIGKIAKRLGIENGGETSAHQIITIFNNEYLGSLASAAPDSIKEKGLLNMLDSNGNGKISLDEFKRYLKNNFGIEYDSVKDKTLKTLYDQFNSATAGGKEIGQDMYNAMHGLGTDTSKINDAISRLSKGNILDAIYAFDRKSKDEGLVQYMANDGCLEVGASRFAKALLRRANEAGATNTPEYIALATYYGAKGTPKYDGMGAIASGDTFTLTKHCGDNKIKEDDGIKVDKMMHDLIDCIDRLEAKNEDSGFNLFGWLKF